MLRVAREAAADAVGVRVVREFALVCERARVTDDDGAALKSYAQNEAVVADARRSYAGFEVEVRGKVVREPGDESCAKLATGHARISDQKS